MKLLALLSLMLYSLLARDYGRSWKPLNNAPRMDNLMPSLQTNPDFIYRVGKLNAFGNKNEFTPR